MLQFDILKESQSEVEANSKITNRDSIIRQTIFGTLCPKHLKCSLHKVIQTINLNTNKFNKSE